MDDLPTVPLPFQGDLVDAGLAPEDVRELPIHEVLAKLRSWVDVTLREHLHGAAGPDWDPEHPDSVAYHENVDIHVDRLGPRLFALQRDLHDAYPEDIPEPEAAFTVSRASAGWTDRLPRAGLVHVHDVTAGQDVTITAVASNGGRNLIGGAFSSTDGEH